MKKLILASFSLLLLYSCSSTVKWQTEYPDNAVEEFVEDKIEDYTGANIDLTPVTGEEIQSVEIFKQGL
jgi:ABC-type glycerol-3-phosphate transport system substrate-binding protein